MPITLDGTNGITTPSYGGADAAEYLVPVTAFKNRIINGAMMFDQRNAGASVTATTSNLYTLDRWQAVASVGSKYTVQQNAGSVTPPAGFINYLGVTSSSAYSIGASDYFNIVQYIEGTNTADLAWGTANAKTITFSFWVRSSLTGTFGGSLRNANANRSYPFSYTISSANTWEQKSITVAGDTSGTWNTDSANTGISLFFGLGVGSNISGTADAWVGANRLSSTGAVSVVGTNGATFYITGVQLEVGSTATSFDTRSYGTELGLCQRYFYKSYNQNIAVGSSDSDGQIVHTACASTMYVGHRWKQNMRTNPTVTFYSIVTAGGTYWNRFDDNTILTTLAQSPNPDGVRIQTSTNTDGQRYGGHIVANAEL